jgi:hypothetical protein
MTSIRATRAPRSGNGFEQVTHVGELRGQVGDEARAAAPSITR